MITSQSTLAFVCRSKLEEGDNEERNVREAPLKEDAIVDSLTQQSRSKIARGRIRI